VKHFCRWNDELVRKKYVTNHHRHCCYQYFPPFFIDSFPRIILIIIIIMKPHVERLQLLGCFFSTKTKPLETYHVHHTTTTTTCEAIIKRKLKDWRKKACLQHTAEEQNTMRVELVAFVFWRVSRVVIISMTITEKVIYIRTNSV